MKKISRTTALFLVIAILCSVAVPAAASTFVIQPGQTATITIEYTDARAIEGTLLLSDPDIVEEIRFEYSMTGLAQGDKFFLYSANPGGESGTVLIKVKLRENAPRGSSCIVSVTYSVTAAGSNVPGQSQTVMHTVSVAEEPPVNLTGLQTQLLRVQSLNSWEYTKESWARVEDAGMVAAYNLSSEDQSAVDAAEKQLKEALDGLVPMDYSDLQDTLDDASNGENLGELSEGWSHFIGDLIYACQQLTGGDQAAVEDANEKLQQSNAALIRQLTALLAERDSLKGSGSVVDEALLKEKEEQIAELKDRLNELESTVAQKDQLLEEKETRLAELEAAIAALETELAGKNETIGELQQTVSDLEYDISVQEEEITTLQERVDTLKSIIEGSSDLGEEYTKLLDQLEELEAELKAAKSELRTTKNELDKAKAELEKVKTQLNEKELELEAAQANLETVKQELEDTKVEMQAQIDSLQAQITETEDKLSETIGKLEAANAQLGTLEAEKDAAIAELMAKLEAANTQIETLIAERDAAVSKLETLREVWREASEELEKIRQERDAALNKVNQAQSSRQETMEALAAAQEAQAQAKADLDAALAKLKQAMQNLENAPDQSGAMEALKEAMADLETAVAEREKALAEQEALRQQLDASHAELEAALEELKAALDKETDAIIVEVEVEPSYTFCNNPYHTAILILLVVSLVLNAFLITLIALYLVKKRRMQHDDTPLVDYDIDDDATEINEDMLE